MPICEVKNEIKGEHGSSTSYYADCKIKFFYVDGNTSFSANQTRYQTDWEQKTYSNPSPEKLVSKIEVWLRQNHNSSSTEAYERNTRVYRYPSNTNAGYLTLNIPPYVLEEANATHFEVNVDATLVKGG